MHKPTSDRRATGRKHPWPMVRLGDVCDEIKDRIQSSKISVGEYVTTDNMVKDRGGIVQAEYVPSDVGLVEYHKGDVLIANIRPYLKKIWLADHNGGCSSDVVVLRSNIGGLSSEYLYSVLSQDAYFEYVMQKPRGTKMPRGDRNWMKEFRFPLPPLSVQHEVVARLERELAAVEKMKKGFEALAETAKAGFKAELKEVFEEISRGGAETRRLGDVCKVQRGGSPRPIKDYITDSTEGLNWIKIGDVEPAGKYITQTVEKIKASGLNKTRKVSAGDFLLSNSMSFGRPYILKIDGCIHDGWLVLKGFSKTFTEDFFYYLLRSPIVQEQFDKLAHGSTVRNLNTDVVSRVSLPLPPLAVQREVVARLDAAKARAGKLELKAREGVAACETMRKAILKEAFE